MLAQPASRWKRKDKKVGELLAHGLRRSDRTLERLDF